jgi:hypothetical protein
MEVINFVLDSIGYPRFIRLVSQDSRLRPLPRLTSPSYYVMFPFPSPSDPTSAWSLGAIEVTMIPLRFTVRKIANLALRLFSFFSMLLFPWYL